MDEFNIEQRRAVEYSGGPQIVLAGPGSGKTRVIVGRVAHMIRECAVAPESIVAVTYTVKAAQELRERLAGLVGSAASGVNAHTFHGLGLRILRRFADSAGLGAGAGAGRSLGTIADSSQRRRLLRQIVREHGLFPEARGLGIDAAVEHVENHIDLCADSAITHRQIGEFVEHARSRLASIADERTRNAEMHRLDRLVECRRAAELYERACRERGWLSFADLIGRPTQLVRESKRVRELLRSQWRHWVVDEFQDVNAAQIELLRALMPPGRSEAVAGVCDLTVVGDDDQSIYGFRGADERAFAKFAEIWEGARVEKLTRNYRSCVPVVRVCGHVIARAIARFAPDKELAAAGDVPLCPVELVRLSKEIDDADAIAAMILSDVRTRPGAALKDYAVVARSRTDLARVGVALELEGVSTVSMGGVSALGDEGVSRVLAVVEAMVEPTAQAHAIVRLLLRPPVSMDVHSVQSLTRRYREAVREKEGDATDQGDKPADMLEWLRGIDNPPAGVSRVLGWFDELARFDAQNPADATIKRIITTIEAVHAHMLSARDRAKRVTCLVQLARFAATRQPRLEEPGDLRAFWAYYQDLNENERDFGKVEQDAAERVDSPADAEGSEIEPVGVRLLTAHSAKGLEFDTVFVPRVTPPNGYPKTRSDEDDDLPEGLIVPHTDGRDAKGRKLDEERRVFYVACSRAQRRLVLLAKKNKTRSKSTHFFEELMDDPQVRTDVVVRELGEVYAEASKLGVGSASAAWRVGEGAVLDRELGGAGETKSEIIARARRRARAMAAAALDRAEIVRAEMDPAEMDRDDAAQAEEARSAAADAAQCVAAAAVIGRTGSAPAWCEHASPGVMAFVEELIRELGTASDAADASGDSAWHRLVRSHLPAGRREQSISYSDLSTYIRCPRCYFVQCVMKLPDRGGDAQAIGTVVHSVLQSVFTRVRDADAEGGAMPGASEIDAIALATYQRIAPSWQRDKATFETIRAQVRAAMALHEAGSNVVELERLMDVPFPPHRVTGRIDRIDQFTGADGSVRLRVVDYKTGAASKAKLEPAGDDLQLVLYAMAARAMFGDEQMPGQAEYWSLSTGQRGVLDFSAMKFEKVQRIVREAIGGILAERFERSKNDKIDHVCDVLAELT